MKNNSSFLVKALIIGCLGLFVTSTSYAQLGKLKEKIAGGGEGKEKKEKIADPYPEDFSDPTGVSGTYHAVVGVKVEVGLGSRMAKIYKVKFTEKENGQFVNRMEIYAHKGQSSPDRFTLDLKETKIMGARFFYESDRYDNGGKVVEAEKGVLLLISNEEKCVDVLVQDAAKLEAWDLEMGQAKYEALKLNANKAIFAQKKERLQGYPAYKDNVGKVVFVDTRDYFTNRNDEPTEDPSGFVKSQSMGKPLFCGAYLEMPLAGSCGADCAFNFVYEMNGVKVDRGALRGSDPSWSKVLNERKGEQQYFCVNANGTGFKLFGTTTWDYSFAKVLYENKDKFKAGQSYKMTVTMFSSRDGNNVAKVAEGVINLTYDAEAMEVLKQVFQKYKIFLDTGEEPTY